MDNIKLNGEWWKWLLIVLAASSGGGLSTFVGSQYAQDRQLINYRLDQQEAQLESMDSKLERLLQKSGG